MSTAAAESASPSPAPSSRKRAWARGILAGPIAFIAAALVMLGGAAWIPKGAAQIDNVVLPIGLFPAIWAALFFYTCLDRRLGRAYLVTLALMLLNAGLAFLVYSRAGAAS